ncbi:MAG: DUF1836 domain-containing protein [Prevotella sp.]|nr:DUF1836 domain-containing protein [Prevotella sp.]
MESYQLPPYHEIPAMGLFLDQVVKYLNQALGTLDGEFKVTAAMISNYVKLKIIDNPSGKTYDRDQIAYLIYITIMKNILPLHDIAAMFAVQKGEYPTQIAYDYFCHEFANVYQYVFEQKPQLTYIGGALTPSKLLLKNAILAIVYKLYVKQQLPTLLR